jgi:hypothetical protein
MSWFSIYITQSDEANAIFRGYFKVDTVNNVTEFYQTIDGVTDFTTTILVDANIQSIPNSPGGNSTNTFQNVFTSGGTLIKVAPFVLGDFTIKKIGLFQTENWNFTPGGGHAVYGTLFLTFIQDNSNYYPPDNSVYVTESILDPTCFNEGTKILCLNKKFEEEYIPIENLRKGDLVKSYKHGYRKIDLIGKNPMINNPEKFNECMYKMEKTKENDLIEDLIITGGHAILVDDLGDNKEENDKIFGGKQMIDDKYLLLSCVSKDFKKIENINLYIYYHFILENNGNNEERYGVWANGILTETPNKNFFMGQKFTLL